MLRNGQFLYEKKVVIDLPDTFIQNMIYTPFISMVVLTTNTKFKLQKNAFNKRIIQGMLSFCLKKIDFFSRRGVDPSPPDFFITLS